MKEFIAISELSKKIINIANMASTLPVNVLIVGQIGVGKKLLAAHILSDDITFDGKFLEQSILNKTINLSQYPEMIVTNIQNVINKKEFMEHLSGIKVVATSNFILDEIEDLFAIKIDIPPLESRSEDLDELTKFHYKKAKDLFDVKIDLDELDIDLSQNGLSLKKSIFKSVFIKSLTDDDIKKSMEYFLHKQIKEKKDYKELLQYFEIPLLDAAKKEFHSQLKMATNLNINRMTLRKKIEQYNLDY